MITRKFILHLVVTNSMFISSLCFGMETIPVDFTPIDLTKPIEKSFLQEPKRSEDYRINKPAILHELNNQAPAAARVEKLNIDSNTTFNIDTAVLAKSPSITLSNESIKLHNENIFLEQLGKRSQSKVRSTFSNFASQVCLKYLKSVFHVSGATKIVNVSFAQIIGNILKNLIFQLSNLTKNKKTQRNNSLHAFKMQIQTLEQQISQYNQKTIYQSPDQMLLLIKQCDRFLQENNDTPFTQPMITQMTKSIQTATSCLYIFNNQNIILSSFDSPADILFFFKDVITNTNNLPKIQFSHNLIQEIYKEDGYMNEIITTWHSFEKNIMYTNIYYRQYAAFLTFLLIFENSIMAASIILDEDSNKYHVAEKVPVAINIASDHITL